MSESCTILAQRVDSDSVPLTCFGVFGRDALQIDGKPPDWLRVIVRCPTSTLTLDQMRAGEPGEELRQVVLGTQKRFRDVKTDAVATRDRLAAWLDTVEYAVELVAEPAFVTEEHHWTCILGIADKLRGVMLYQKSLCNGSGSLILDLDGNWEDGAMDTVT
jgi:hypothetical protein